MTESLHRSDPERTAPTLLRIMSDILTIQDDIAGKVTKALRQSIATTNPTKPQ